MPANAFRTIDRSESLVNPSQLEKEKARFYRTRRALEFGFLPQDHQVSEFALYIFEDIVSILSMENNNLIGVKITNQHIADNFIQLFEALRKAGGED